MTNSNQSILEQLEKLLSRRQSNEWLAHRLNITVQEVKNLKKELKDGEENEWALVGYNQQRLGGEETIIRNNIDRGIIEVIAYYDHPPTPEEIISDHKIDIKEWKLSNFWSKQKSKGYQVSALFSKRGKEDKLPVLISDILNRYKTIYKPISKKDIIINDKFANPSSLLLSLPDLHIDKLTIDKISTEEQCNKYSEVLDNLLHKSYASHYLEEIVFVLGNDLYQTDTINNTTSKGTPVSTAIEYDESYEVGFDLMVKSINKIKQFCNKLYIILTPGNHCISKEFYLAHALEVYFKSDSNIIFNRTKDDLKTHKYGETLYCFSHGNNINDKLPLAFATQFYEQWGQCKYKDIILGDKHYNSEKLFKVQGEAMGVRMRILPSLSGTDNWHQRNLFIGSIQSGIALIYDKERGKVSEFEYRA